MLQVDGYDGFKRLAKGRVDRSVRLAYCWVHMRWAFCKFHASTKSPVADEPALMRVIRTLRATWRALETWHRRGLSA